MGKAKFARAGPMKAVKKNAIKKEKAMSSTALSDQIALKQYQDTIAGINSAVDKRRDLAPRVLHMLSSGMLGTPCQHQRKCHLEQLLRSGCHAELFY